MNDSPGPVMVLIKLIKPILSILEFQRADLNDVADASIPIHLRVRTLYHIPPELSAVLDHELGIRARRGQRFQVGVHAFEIIRRVGRSLFMMMRLVYREHRIEGRVSDTLPARDELTQVSICHVPFDRTGR